MPTELERFEKAITSNFDKFWRIKREVVYLDIHWILNPCREDGMTIEYCFSELGVLYDVTLSENAVRRIVADRRLPF